MSEMKLTDELIARLERLADRYEANNLSGQARGVRHALREVRAFYASVELRMSSLGDPNVRP